MSRRRPRPTRLIPTEIIDLVSSDEGQSRCFEADARRSPAQTTAQAETTSEHRIQPASNNSQEASRGLGHVYCWLYITSQ